MTRRLIELTRLNCERSIDNGASGYVHVAHFEEMRRFDCPSDLHRAVTISRKVHRSRLIVTVITPLMDGRDSGPLNRIGVS